MSSLPPAYFDALYGGSPDPWAFATSDYEAGKYAATMAALPRARYRSALEIGCSIGVLTGALAQRCDAVTAVDVAEAALEQARARNAGQSHVRFACQQFPVAVPEGKFDLILLSEVLYYLDRPAIAAAARATRALVLTDADVLLVHWLGPTPDYPLNGEEAAEAFIGALSPDAAVLKQDRTEQYRIDLLRL